MYDIGANALFESSQDCAKILDDDGVLLSINGNGECLLELDDNHGLIGQHWIGLWPAESQPAIAAALARARNGDTARFSAFCPTAKGTPKWWDVVVMPLPGASEVPRLLAVSRDVTALRDAQCALHETAKRLSFTLDAAAIGSWDLDLDSGSWRHSLRHDQCFGYQQALPEWQLSTLLAHVHSVDRDRVAHQFANAAAGPWQLDCRVVWPDTSVHCLRISGDVYLSELDGSRHLLGIVSDITEHRQADLEREQFVSLVEHSVEFNAMCDVQGKPFYINGAGCALLGFDSREQAVGNHLADFFFPEDRAFITATFLPQVCREGAGKTEIRVRHRASGETAWIILSAYVLRDAAGAPTALAVVGHDFTAAKRVESELRQSKERFALLLNSSGEGIYGIGPDAECTFLNAAGARMLGYASDELVGLKLHALIHHHRADGSDYPLAECPINIGAREGHGLRVDDEVFWHRDGTPVPVAYSVHPILVEGQRAGAVITFSDVSERRKLEAERERMGEQRRLALDAAELGAWHIAPDTRSLSADERFLSIFGIDRHFELDQVIELIHPEDRPHVAAALAASMSPSNPAPYAVEHRIVRPDGKVVWAFAKGRASLVRTGQQEVLVSLDGTIADITARKEAEHALRASEARMRIATEAAELGIWMWDVATDVVRWENARTYQIFGLAVADPPVNAERFFRDVLHPDDLPAMQRAVDAALNEGARLHVQCRIFRVDNGATRWLEFTGHRQQQGTEAPLQLLGMVADITETVEQQDSLRQLAADLSAADRRKTEFLATLAHELRNPLAPIRNGLHVMRLANDDPATIGRVREMMERQLGHMVHLVNDLLDIARISSGKFELHRAAVELRTIAASAVETSAPLIEANRHELRVDITAQSLLLDADSTRLAQVISNLLNNAAKYTPPGGRIVLAARRDGDEAVIEVSDNGIGIPQDMQSAIFEMFAQLGGHADRAPGGLGIGLSLVRRLVAMHGGSVQALSEGVGRGSTFLVRLPLANAAFRVGERVGAPRAAALPQAEPVSPKLRVLVVDDNVDAADTLGVFLGLDGHTIRVAHDGFQALQQAREFVPQVVFLDIGLPRMNGYEVAGKLLAMPALKGVKLVALTGWGSALDRARSLDAGFAHHLVKPIDPAIVTGLLKKMA